MTERERTERIAARAFPSGKDFELVKEAVTAIRQIRADYTIPLGKTINAYIEVA